MAQSNSDSAYRRWRVEHARDTETRTSPRSAATDEAGEALQRQNLGQAALQIIKEHSSSLALDLTRRSGRLEVLGEILLEIINLDDVPSRLEIQQDLIEQGLAEPGELSMGKIESRRLKLLLDQLTDEDIVAVAMTLCQGDRDWAGRYMSVDTIIDESREVSDELRAEETLQAP